MGAHAIGVAVADMRLRRRQSGPQASLYLFYSAVDYCLIPFETERIPVKENILLEEKDRE